MDLTRARLLGAVVAGFTLAGCRVGTDPASAGPPAGGAREGNPDTPTEPAAPPAATIASPPPAATTAAPAPASPPSPPTTARAPSPPASTVAPPLALSASATPPTAAATARPSPTLDRTPAPAAGAPCADPRTVCLAPGELPRSGAKGDDTPPSSGTTDCVPKERIYHVCNGMRAYSGPARVSGKCCYSYCQQAVPCGRPFVVAGERLRAPEVERRDWLAALDAPGWAASAELAAAWAADAREEHASVAAFARLSLDLLAVGAPPDLVAGAHAAALDEIRHAKLTWAIAAAFGGAAAAHGPGPLPMLGLEVHGDVVDLGARAVAEGCVGETLSAMILDEAARRCSEPALAAVLAAIARDELAHAELSWRVAAWAASVGGPHARAAMRAAWADAIARPMGHGAPGDAREAARGGRLTQREVDEVVARARATVLEPCFARLVEAAAA